MTARRSIDPKIRSSRNFAKLTYRQRDLWQGMIEIGADDQGRMPGDPAYVRSKIWPYDDIPLAEVQADLDRLQEIGNILIYQVGDDPYIQLVNWHIYQADAEWLAASSFPAPLGWIDHARYHGKANKIVTLNWDTRLQGNTPSPLPTPLPSPLPSGLPSDDVNVNGDVNDDVKGDDDGDGNTPPPLSFEVVQGWLEQTTGLAQASQGVVEMINELVLLEINKADVEDGFNWHTKNKGQVRYLTSLAGPIKTSHARRIQNLPKKPTIPPGTTLTIQLPDGTFTEATA